MHQKLWLMLFCRRYISFLYINIGFVIFVSVPISVITSISLKKHRLSTIPDQFIIGSQSRKCWKMIERKQRVKQLRRFDIETTQKNPRRKLIEISSILKVESTLKFSRRINVIISTWIRLSKSLKSPRTFHVEFRRRIDGKLTKMCSSGRRNMSLVNEVIFQSIANLLPPYSQCI